MSRTLFPSEERKSPARVRPLLEVEDFSVVFRLPEGRLHACQNISFDVGKGESLGIVGESGSGKSVSVLSMMGLVQGDVSGRLFFKGRPMSSLKSVRGREVSMVFQNPLNSLNPSLKIGLQLSEVLIEHLGLSKAEARGRVRSMMERLAIPDPAALMKRYPFEYSGGMRQRVMIAMAMLCEPSLLIADEPTTALDVTNQAQILHLFRELQENFGTSLIFISHDLGVVSQISQRIMVLYAGRRMEFGPSETLFSSPLHPYTQGLLRSIPRLLPEKRKAPLASISGNVPGLIHLPGGCRYHPRCEFVSARCRTEQPPAFHVGRTAVHCWLYEGMSDSVDIPESKCAIPSAHTRSSSGDVSKGGADQEKEGWE